MYVDLSGGKNAVSVAKDAKVEEHSRVFKGCEETDINRKDDIPHFSFDLVSL